MTENTKRKTGIRRKITLLILVSNMVIMMVGIGMGYVLGFKLLYDVIGSEHQQMARLVGTYIAGQLNKEMEDLQTYATRPLWIDFVKESDSKLGGQDDSSREAYFIEMDKRWSAPDKDDPLVNDLLSNRPAVSMQDILKLRKDIKELFMTDRFGAVVSASGKTTDFYQADEEWWQAAYNGGRGGLYMSDVEFDESTKSWSISMAAPMRDRDGSVIGICKEVISAKRLFDRLVDFKIGRTGHAVLIDKNGRVLYHEGIVFPVKWGYSKAALEGMSENGKNYLVEYIPPIHNKKMLSAFARVPSVLLSERGIEWTVIISQEASEAFAPVKRLMALLALIVSILIVILWPIGYVFSRIFVKPLHELHIATEEIIKGDWDYPIDIRTNDEVEQFAEAYKEMILNIKDKQQELLRAKEDLEALSRDLEKKVEERTIELNRTQEATLNILEDLTEAKDRLEKYAGELEEALQVKSEFTSTVSHELRTPLAAIKEGIAIVVDGTSGPLRKEQVKFLGIAKRNVDRLARLIDGILDFQKLEAGKMVFNIEENDMNEVAREAAATMAALAKDKGLEFILDLDDALPRASFDRDKITQVLANLVTNAIKFTEKGSVTIRTSRGDNFIQVSVKDTGIGIKKEDVPKLFQQFEQLAKGIERKPGGSGLGLVISKEIIEKLNGRIWVESEFGKGTAFHFLLPVQERRGASGGAVKEGA